jgi:hypothetical protein
VWADLVKQHGGTVEMREVDRDTAEGRRWADQYRIYAQPGFVVWNAEGMVTYQGLGPSNRAGLIALVEKAAANAP